MPTARVSEWTVNYDDGGEWTGAIWNASVQPGLLAIRPSVLDCLLCFRCGM